MMPYSPAARGNIASSSAYVSAPASDNKPATSQTLKALPGVPTLHVITRALRNTPVPMTFATLTEIAATKPRPRMSWPFVSFEFGVSSFTFIKFQFMSLPTARWILHAFFSTRGLFRICLATLGGRLCFRANFRKFVQKLFAFFRCLGRALHLLIHVTLTFEV